jgi:hypothetical protein
MVSIDRDFWTTDPDFLRASGVVFRQRVSSFKPFRLRSLLFWVLDPVPPKIDIFFAIDMERTVDGTTLVDTGGTSKSPKRWKEDAVRERHSTAETVVLVLTHVAW